MVEYVRIKILTGLLFPNKSIAYKLLFCQTGFVQHVGWWSPTVIRGDDREAVHIPNHKFTVNIVRNLSQKTHWRIKTHIAISHLDVNKINNIVADMRKVLSKNPQIEQQKLHRRVFLDNIDTESQALLIMISCFVKTSRFEEYQCVKEAILLDLLRVISHHRARLATPMRTVQKIYRDADAAPFVETIFSRTTETAERPLLLVEPQYKIYNDDKSRTSARPLQRNEGKVENSEATPPSDTKVDPKAGPTLNKDNNKVEAGSVSSESDIDSSTKVKVAAKTSDASGQNVEETASKGLLTEKELPLKESITDEMEITSTTAHGKQEAAEKHVPSSPKTILEENIVLGVALEGSKRMLQIEEEPVPPTATPEGKNMTGLGKDKQEESNQAPTAVPSGQRETDR